MNQYIEPVDEDRTAWAGTRRDFLTGGVTGILALTGFQDLAGGSGKQDTSAATTSVRTIEQLRSRPGDPGDIVYVEGYHEPGDRGGGLFVHTMSEEASKPFRHERSRDALWTPAADSGQFWIRIFSPNEPISAKWFGAQGDRSADASGAINDAIWVAGYLGVRRVHIPAGRYRVDSPVVLSWTSGHELTGDGPLTTILEKTESGTTTTDLSTEPIDAVILIPAGMRETDNGDKTGVDTHSLTIRNLQVRGQPAEKGEPLLREHGIYIERAHRISLENLYITHFDCGLTAQKLWMSRLTRLRGKHIRTFINLSARPESDDVAGACTSLNIENCYCSDDVRGDAFVLGTTYYTTLQNCGADAVEGWPFVVDRSRSVSLIACGFEQSQNGKGILYRGSTGTIISCNGIYPHFPKKTANDSRREPDIASVLWVTDDERGRKSTVTVLGTHFSNYGSPRSPRTSGSSAQPVYRHVVDSGSAVTVINTRFPRNVSPPTDEQRPQGVLRDISSGVEQMLNSSADHQDGQTNNLSSVQGTGDDTSINENFARLEAKIATLMAALNPENAE